MQLVLNDGGGDVHVSMNVVTSGANDITCDWTCGLSGSVNRKHTATTTTLTILDEDDDLPDVFTKQ